MEIETNAKLTKVEHLSDQWCEIQHLAYKTGTTSSIRLYLSFNEFKTNSMRGEKN